MIERKFGPPIRHTPGDPCPWPEEVGMVCFSGVKVSMWQSRPPKLLSFWYWRNGAITAYRLRADHPFYARKGRRELMGVEPDGHVVAYSSGTFGVPYCNGHRPPRHGINRIGIWRVYLKGDPV